MPRLLNWMLSFLNLWIHKKRSSPLFAFEHRSKDLAKTGVTSLSEAWFRESPRPLDNDENAFDEISFSGVNGDGAVIAVRIARRHSRSAEVHVYLKLASGEEFQLPFQPHTTVHNTFVSRNFTAAGLTFELLEPLRRWRIRFNGCLRRGITSEWSDLNTSNIYNVNFNFIWHPMYNYIAFPQDFEPSILADFFSADSSSSLFRRPCDILREEWHEQIGQISGTIDIEGRDQFEFMARGLKVRRHGILDWSSVRNDVSIIGVVENGNAFHLFANDVNGGLTNFVYGYVMPPHNWYTLHVTKWRPRLADFNVQQEFTLQFQAGGKKCCLEMSSTGERFRLFKGVNWNVEMNVGIYRVKLNGINGFAIAHCGCPYSNGSPVPIPKSISLLKEIRIEGSRHCVVTFEDPECCSGSVVGGKASSLSLITNLLCSSENCPDLKFSIADGLCLTKTAFNRHMQSNTLIRRSILDVEDIAWYARKRSPGLLDEACSRLANSLHNTDLSLILKDQLWVAMVNKYGQEFETTMKFAVRSSALGEDSEEMSAAGLHETFLGVKGFENICLAIVKCWASHFAYRSVEYRRQNGQLINAGMGVVIQEMVDADIAGVLFTRHPLTGSPGYMMIASNYGLGESVASAATDTDTVILKRLWTDRLEVHETQIGNKKIKIMMSDDDNGIISTKNSAEVASKCSLSESLALRLGEIAIYLEQCFGSSRDIEWAITKNEIWLLQCRPVTTEGAMTVFEVIHEFDSATRTDYEQYTTANVAEVLPGAATPLTVTTEFRAHNASMFVDFSPKVDIHRYDPTVLDGPVCFYGHFLFDLIVQKSFSPESKKDAFMKGMEIGMFGRVLDDDNIAKMSADRYEAIPLSFRLRTLGMVLSGILFRTCILKHTTRKYRNFVVPVTDLTTSSEVYRAIQQRYYLDWSNSGNTHIKMTLASSLWNVLILNLLAGSDGEYTLEKYTDFATLIGSRNGVESGNVPFALQELAKAIVEEFPSDVFSSMQVKDATYWCMHTSSKISKLFCKFLQRHGHRGFKEFELKSISWSMEPECLIRVLQGLVRNLQSAAASEDLKMEQHLSSKISTQLSRFKRWMLSLIVSRAKQSVCDRELSKSILVKTVDGYRYAFRHLARLMIQEGLLPDSELIFFFTFEEIGMFLESRSPTFIRRAKQRQRLHPYMDSLTFDELISGFPKPISSEKENSSSNDIIKGYPVCHGEVRGVARVVSFEEVNKIQAGDILITHATDICWSPYFPMLSGIVTEIGGLISHGAVVAREFGLPCLVGAHGATLYFNSGDNILLNATEGFICKLDKCIEVSLDQ